MSVGGRAGTKGETETGRDLPRLWPLLFPATYLVHIAEEVWGGFPAWASRVSGVVLTDERFMSLNAFAFCVMLLANLAAAGFREARWLMLPFAAAVSLNGLAHLAGSLSSASYSPGLVSGLLLWVPLGLHTLRRARPAFPRAAFWAAVGAGLALHGLLLLTVLTTR